MTERFHAATSSTGRANAVDALGRRLRRKFILVAMGAVTVVLTLIIAGINIVNYSHVCKMADARLDYILAGKDGIDGEDEPKTGPGQDAVAGKVATGNRAAVRDGHFEGMTAESPFDTRYFTVSIAGGQVTDVNTARIAAVGFVQYLPRRWAKPGCEDKFWQGAANGMDVLAFGLSAYTRLDGMITTNTSDLNTYLAHSADYEQITVSTVPVQTTE